jgi:hypothetical protein
VLCFWTWQDVWSASATRRPAVQSTGNLRRTKFLKIKTCCNRAFLKRALNFSLRELKPGTTKQTERYCWEITLVPRGGWGFRFQLHPLVWTYYLVFPLAVGIRETCKQLNVCVVKESVLTNTNISRRSFCVCAHWRQQVGGSVIGPESFDFVFYCQAETFVLGQYRLLHGYLCSSLRVWGQCCLLLVISLNLDDTRLTFQIWVRNTQTPWTSFFFALSCMCIRGAV